MRYFLFSCIFLFLSLIYSSSGAAVAGKTTVTGIRDGVVDETLVFVINPKNSSGGDVIESNLNFQVSFSPNVDNQVQSLIVYEPSTGKYSVEYRTTVAAEYTISITLDSTPLFQSPFTAKIVAGDVDSQRSTFTGDGWILQSTAGKISVFGIEFRDKFGNIVNVAQGDVDFSVDYSDIIANPPPIYSNRFQSSQQITFEYSTNRTGGIELLVKLFNVNFWAKTITVISSDVDEQNSIANLDTFLVPWPIAGVSGSITIFTRDKFGNPVLPAFISSDPAQFQMHISLLENGKKVRNYTFTSGLNNDELIKATGYVITFQELTIAGDYSLEVVRNGKHVAKSPNTFKIIPSDIDGTKTEVLKNFTQTENVGDTYSFIIQARDTYGNNRINGGFAKDFTVEISSGPNTIVPPIQDLGNGKYSVTYKYEKSGKYIVDAFFFLDVLVGSGQSVLAITETSPADSTANGQGLKSCKIGSKCRFIVQVRDKFLNNQTEGNEEISVKIGSRDLKYTSENLGNGLYAIEYTGSSGSKLSVLIKNEHISDSPFSVYMAPSDAAAGIIVAIVIFIVVAACLFAYIVYKRRQVMALRKEWEIKKSGAYKEYQTQEGPPIPLNNALANPDEPEWEDDEFANNRNNERENDPEFRAMAQWVK